MKYLLWHTIRTIEWNFTIFTTSFLTYLTLVSLLHLGSQICCMTFPLNFFLIIAFVLSLIALSKYKLHQFNISCCNNSSITVSLLCQIFIYSGCLQGGFDRNINLLSLSLIYSGPVAVIIIIINLIGSEY